MPDIILNNHISQGLNQHLEDAKSKLLELGGIVEEQLELALKAIESSNTQEAGYSQNLVKQVHQKATELDEQCAQILARYQPTAGDLRLTLAVVHSIKDLYLINYESSRIQKMALSNFMIEAPVVFEELQAIGLKIKTMLQQSLDALARFDGQTARQIIETDKSIQDIEAPLLQEITQYMTHHADNIGNAINILWAVKSLQKIGEHNTSIAKSLLYFIEGQFNRYHDHDKSIL